MNNSDKAKCTNISIIFIKIKSILPLLAATISSQLMHTINERQYHPEKCPTYLMEDNV
jgi:hypothetical protein